MNSLRLLIGAVVMALAAAHVVGDDLEISADSTRASVAEGKEYTLLSGNAIIRSGTTRITADEIEASGSAYRYLYCRGNVRLEDSERGIRLRSDELFYDRELELTRIDGYTEMEDLTNDVVVKGGFFEYLGQEELVLIQINVRILKVTEESEITCRAEFVRYRRDEDTLELTGVPRVTYNEDEYAASRIVINLETDEIFLDEGVRGTIVDSGENE